MDLIVCCDSLNISFYYLNTYDPTQIIISLFSFVSNVLKLDEDNAHLSIFDRILIFP